MPVSPAATPRTMGNVSEVAESDPHPELHTSDDTLLAGYPGTALLVRNDGAVLATNVKGIALEALLREQPVPDLVNLIRESAAGSKITARTINIDGRHGVLVLHVCVVPQVAPDKLILLINDLTMERNLRAALTSSRQRYKDLVEISSDFYWEVDENEVFTFVPARGTLGYSASELVGRSPKEIVWEPHSYEVIPFLVADPLDDREISLRHADGTRRNARIASRPIVSDDDGSTLGVRGICTQLRED